MTQYIDKSALVAEIKRLIGSYKPLKTLDPTYCEGLNDSLDNILSFIDTLEVKEVDLEEEFDNYTKDILACDVQFEPFTHLHNCAKHFFELGLSASNPITAEDRGTVEEIIINLKRVEGDYRIDLTKEIEWVRNKVNKG